MIKNDIFLKKITHLIINFKVWCTSTLIYVGCTVEFAFILPLNWQIALPSKLKP